MHIVCEKNYNFRALPCLKISLGQPLKDKKLMKNVINSLPKIFCDTVLSRFIRNHRKQSNVIVPKSKQGYNFGIMP